MSDETDVERLLENFQKALDTLNNIGNVEALITKLDANKNRKLLKKVKHVVGEVHNKVGTVKEKVSKAYKRVKLLSSSESEDVPLPGNADKEVSDGEKNPLDQGESILQNIDDEGRHSPIVGGKGKHLKRTTRQTDKSQKSRKQEIHSLESPGHTSNEQGQSKKGVCEQDDVIMEDKDASVEEMGQRMDVDDSEADNAANSTDNETQIEADDIDQIETPADSVNEENDTEGENSQDIVNGTPEKPSNKMSLSLRRNRDTTKEETVVKDHVDKGKNKFKKLNQGDNKEDKQEDSDSEIKMSRSRRQKNKYITNKLKNISDSDEEKDKTSRKLRSRRNRKKGSDASDEEEDTFKKSSNRKSRKSRHTETPTVTSDSDEADKIEDGSNSEEETSKSNRKKDTTSEDLGIDSSDSDKECLSKLSVKLDKKKDKASDVSDSEEESLKEKAKNSDSKKGKITKIKEKPKDASDNDEGNKIEEDGSKSDVRSSKNNVDTSKDNEKNVSDSDEDCISKLCDKIDKDNASDSDKAEKMDEDDRQRDSDTSDDEEEKIKGTPENSSRENSKKRKKTNEQKVASDSDESDSNKKKDKTNEDKELNEENNKAFKKLQDKKDKTKNKKDASEDEEQLTDDSNDQKNKEKPKAASELTTEKSSDDKASDNEDDANMSVDEDKNKKKSSEVLNDSIVIIEDTPKKRSEERDKDEDGEKDSSISETKDKTTENEDDDLYPPIPKIKLVDINKLLAPNVKPLDPMTPSPKGKKCVTFDSSVIILSSSDEETPKKDPKNKDQSPLKSAMRKSASKEADNSDSDTKENNENLRNTRSKRHDKTENKILKSDHSSDESDDSDFQESRKSRRLKRHETKTANLKDKFAKLASKYSERRSRATTARRLRGDDDKEESKHKKKKKGNKDKKNNSDSENDSEKDSRSLRSKKRRRKKYILETSNISDPSDHSDVSDFEVTPKRKSGPKSRTDVKKAKVSYPEADLDDPKFKAGVVVRLPLFKCEELPDIYKLKKELFEVKKLTNMDFTRRTRSARNGPVKSSDDPEKPEKKRIKLTLKLNRKTKPKDESDDDERSSTEDNKDQDVEKNGAGKKDGKKKDKGALVVPMDVLDCADANDDLLADACLEQVKDNSDKEESDKQSEASDSDKDDDTKKKDKTKKKKDSQKNKKGKENDAEDSDEENSEDKEKKSHKKNKGSEPKVNGTLSDSEEESDTNHTDDNKDSKDGSSDEGEDGKKKKGKNWKNDKLLKEKIDSSDSDDDFAKFSKKKDKSKSELVRKAKKRMKKSSLISDSESDDDENKGNKKGKGSDDDYRTDDKSSSESGSGSEKEDKSEDSEEEKKKPARKRIKRVKDSSSDEDDKSTRKHIRRMIDRDSLSDTTKKAEQEEKNRKARIADKQKKYNQIFDLKADATVDKVVLDFDEKTDQPLLSVSKKLAKQLKPHQVHGIKFMWDACFESLARLKKNAGSGCILAHCMGLGKTLQVIALIHALLTNSDKTKVEKILVVCPVNTVLNWKSEFKKWIPKGNEFEVYELVSCKTSYIHHERNHIVREWHENGGVLIIGYNMFRTLSNPENKTISKKLRNSFQEGLVDPGPDLVVCDEGHLLKNEKTNLSIAMNRIKTPRRIVLTGTPLQNNLKEYWCMVQFIKPNLLGTYKEYMNRFVNPIINGQYTDSTQHDIVVMRRRSHVLHKLLDGVVQRQDYSVLEPYLPPKYEYVLFLKLTEVQIKLYKHYMDNFARRGDGSNRTSFLFTDFQQLQRICTHPRVLLDKSIEDKDKKEHNDESESEGSLKDFIDDDESEAVSTSSGSDGSGSKSGSETSIKSDEEKKKKKVKKAAARRKRVTRAQAAKKREDDDESDSDVEVVGPKEWWQEYIDNEELDNINHSAKIFLLFQILKECEEIGDKILVFSQSLYTLNCIEYFLQRIDEATQNGDTEKVGGHSGSWHIGLDYFRLDGSSSCDNRASWCDHFNDPDNIRARLFLISTRAGGLGINLVAANRVIIFDVSWNPSHDIQSIYRVYRFGQMKPSYIYRFVTYGAMEMKIYERQVTKQAISKRVIDEQQIDRHYSQNDIQELYKTELDPTDRPIPMVPKDVLLGEMLQKYDKTIFKYHEHQSLLENKQDEELNEEERKAAWEEFENEKDLRKTTLTNFSGINLATFQNQMNFSPQLIQVALANIVRKDNPAWSEVQIRGILPALVTQLQMQMTENDFSMYNRVHQEIRLMQQLQAQRMRERYFQQYQLQQMLQKQQLTNQMLGNLNVTPEELRRLQQAASQNYIQPPPPRSTAGGSGDVIELND